MYVTMPLWLAILMSIVCASTGAQAAPVGGLGAKNDAAQRAGLAWELVSMSPPVLVWANRTSWIELEVRNVGSATWSAANHDSISYHWRDDKGALVEFEGHRTKIRRPVAKGESLRIFARVSGPPTSGRFVLEWEPVREGVAWFGPPQNGLVNRVNVVASWRCGLLQLLAAAVGIGGAVALRRARARRSSAWTEHAAAWVWVPWAWLIAALTGVTFSELSDIEIWGRALTIAVCGAAFVALPLPALPAHLRSWITAVLLCGLATLAFADLIYLNFFGSLIPMRAVGEAQQLADVHSSVLSLTQIRYAWFAVAPVATVAMAALMGRRRPHAGRHDLATRGGVFSVLVLIGLPAVIGIREVLSEPVGTHVVSEVRSVQALGFLNAHILDVSRQLRAAERSRAGPGERERITRWFAARAKAHAAKSNDPWFGAARGKNLVVVQVESAQQWIVGTRVFGQEITPYLNELSRSALYFPNVTDQTGIGMTADAEYAVLNSQHPLPDTSVAFMRSGNGFVTLAHALRGRGYATLSAHPYDRNFWNRAVLHPRYGFDRSLFRDELGTGMVVGWGLADGLFFERMIPVLRGQRRPFFTFLVTLSLHHPFEYFPPELAELDLQRLENRNLANYLQAMRYFDRSLREFVVALERAGLRQDTLIAVYGDHDPRFSLDREVLRLVGIDRPSAAVYHELDRIPFFVLLPPGITAGVHDLSVVGGHVDIAPTLLHLLGVERPASFVGRTMLGDFAPEYAARPNGTAVLRDRLFVRRGRDIGPKGACFSRPTLAVAPLAACDGIAGKVAEELEVSRRTADLDLQRSVAGIR